MQLEAGEFYLSAGGNIYEIDYISNNCCYTRDSGIEYFLNGKFWNDDSESSLDLIAHIPKELHWSIINQINSYHRNINSKNKIIRRYKNFCNKKSITIPD